MQKRTLLEVAESNLLDYARYTIEQRAFGDFRDGLKPVQRRVLWVMFENGWHADGPTRKCARVVGDTIGKYHPHGDGACYEALVNMANASTSLINKQGNFGDYQDPPAHYRYTECRLSKYSDMYLLDKQYMRLVPMLPNYSGEFQEPLYLPAKLPNLLVNGTGGIAVAVSCNIPPFTLQSVSEVAIKAIKQPVTAKDCLALEFGYVTNPKLVSGTKTMLDYFKTGKGQIEFRCRVERLPTGLRIVSGTPYFNDEATVTKLRELSCVSSVINRCGEKIDIEVKFKRGQSNKQATAAVMSLLHSTVSYSTRITHRTIEVDDQQTMESRAEIEMPTIPELINKWAKYRIDLERQVVALYISDAKAELKRQQLWLLAASKIDILTRIIKSRLKDRQAYKDKVAKTLKISVQDADLILDRTLIQLSALDKQAISSKIVELKKTIANLNEELKHPKRRVISQLNAIAKGEHK